MANDPQDLLGASFDQLAADGSFSPHTPPEPQFIGQKGYVSLQLAGMSLVLSENRTVRTVQLRRAGHEGYSAFSGRLPLDLRFDMSRAQVREALGMPQDSAPAQDLPILGRRGPWDLFIQGGLSVHLQYEDAGTGIELISLSATAA